MPYKVLFPYQYLNSRLAGDTSFFCNIITIVIIHAVNHSYNLSFFSINIKMFSLFLHILCSKRGETSVFI